MKERVGAAFIPPEGVTLPRGVDWRERGAVTPVQDQGECAASWAFITVQLRLEIETKHTSLIGKLKRKREKK